jgi:pyruvate dehydrogenase E2 component (dihydrolipoamide acetyltransferase)
MLVKLPNLGEGADSGSVASVLVQVGDQIEKNQTIIEIESEKALVPVPSPVAGKVIAVKTSEGATISVGQPILEVESDGAEAEAPATSADASPAPSLRPAAAPVQISASPASQADTPAPIVDFSQWGPVRSEPLTELRKIISQRMVASKRTAPHVTQFDNVDITDLNALRKEHSAAWKEKGAPLTLTVFAIKAVVETLKKHPNFNASLDEQAGQIVFKDYYHIGIAVDTEAGLMVPTLRDADKLSLFEIASSLTELAVKARERKLTKADMQGGTFTISNQGGIGGAHFTPVINLPESAILGIGRGSVQPAVVDGAIEPRLMMPIAISYDHRTIDGGAAARFTVDLAAAFGQFTADDLKL